MMGLLFLVSAFLGMLLAPGSLLVAANNRDLFNYRFTNEAVPGGGGTDYGQQNWGDVTCDSLRYCVSLTDLFATTEILDLLELTALLPPFLFFVQTGYDEKYLYGKGFTIEGNNNCKWCVEGGPENCGLHRQSPIDLKRDRAIPGNPNEKECPDWHYMQYRDDTCDWEDMKSQFEILREALRITIPILPNGDIDCLSEDGIRQFPRLDYSKGFPDWWWLDHIDITVPSSHTQEGKRYAAEVVLAHFYEIPHEKNQVSVLFCDNESRFAVVRILC